MNKIEEALWRDYNKLNSLIGGLSIESNEYKVAVEARDKLYNALIKLEQTEQENKRDKMRMKIDVGEFLINTTVVICTIIATFKFDKVSTVTSTVGRPMLTGVVPKLFRGRR